MRATVWKKYAPDGWKPTRKRGGTLREDYSAMAVVGELLDMAATRYWENRPDPRKCQTVPLESVDSVHMKESA